mmetsp:Transcript_15678/g.59625  ORF Transcript_15678/g.59625 Transcript_15678/m.59625 type:complete len:206 (-) Transcript_15678:374-991(-)
MSSSALFSQASRASKKSIWMRASRATFCSFLVTSAPASLDPSAVTSDPSRARSTFRMSSSCRCKYLALSSEYPINVRKDPTASRSSLRGQEVRSTCRSLERSSSARASTSCATCRTTTIPVGRFVALLSGVASAFALAPSSPSFGAWLSASSCVDSVGPYVRCRYRCRCSSWCALCISCSAASNMLARMQASMSWGSSSKSSRLR